MDGRLSTGLIAVKRRVGFVDDGSARKFPIGLPTNVGLRRSGSVAVSCLFIDICQASRQTKLVYRKFSRQSRRVVQVAISRWPLLLRHYFLPSA